MPEYADILDALRACGQSRKVAAKKPAAPRFAAKGQIEASGLSVSVDGLGALDLPLGPAQARALHALGERARFGQREQTLLDSAVRDTGEIGAASLSVDWDAAARTTLLRQVAAALGVEALDCRVHSLLVYAPGQFFKTHQDTEKGDGMVGTLVLVWPGGHIGGALRIEQGERALRFESQQLGQDSALRWCSFYADCRHEVEPVTEGWRVVLTFDLIIPASAKVPQAAPDAALVSALGALFDAEGGPRPAPFVFLLDHEYSEHGLYWRLLKGQDRQYAQALRAAADELGFSVHLALAEHHEVWDAQYSGRHAKPHKGTLIDDDFTLSFWRDSEDRMTSRDAVSIAPEQVACLTESGKEHLHNEEYEGYMGNYGETLEYWYRRAALVIQSPLGAMRMRFRADVDTNLDELAALAARDDDRVPLDTIVAAVGDLIVNSIRQHGRARFAPVATVAARQKDGAQAKVLIEAFAPESFVLSDAESFASLEHAHGARWMLDLLQTWASTPASNRHHSAGTRAPGLWPRELTAFLQRASEAGLSSTSVSQWLTDAVAALERYDAARRNDNSASRQALLGPMVDAVAELARALALRPELPAANRLIAHLRALPRCYPPEYLAPVVHALGAACKSVSGESFRASVIAALEHRLAASERADDDHALVNIEWGCRCADCTVMIRWAEGRSGAPLVQPMAESRRLHLTGQIRQAGAPLTHRIIEQGRPYRLELTKPADLQQRERLQRSRCQAELAALR